jgi:hypothetical protein
MFSALKERGSAWRHFPAGMTKHNMALLSPQATNGPFCFKFY